MDKAEVLWTDLNIYTFKGAIGVGEFSDHQESSNVVYVTICDSQSDGGTVKILALREEQVGFWASFIDANQVQAWLDTDGVPYP